MKSSASRSAPKRFAGATNRVEVYLNFPQPGLNLNLAERKSVQTQVFISEFFRRDEMVMTLGPNANAYWSLHQEIFSRRSLLDEIKFSENLLGLNIELALRDLCEICLITSARGMEKSAYWLGFCELVVKGHGFTSRQHVRGNLPFL